MDIPPYEVFAIRYARRDGRRPNQFIGGDPHDVAMPLEYFVWVARSADRTFVIDTGFTAETAARRKRDYLRPPSEGLALLGVKTEDVRDVIITHLHYDHAGTLSEFLRATFHLQDDEIAYATGRHMAHKHLSHAYDVDDVVDMVRMVYKGRVIFRSGSAEIAPGLSVHRIGGHTAGLQSVRVFTKRGWVVLASDACHFYEHFETGRGFPNVFHLGDMLEGYHTLRHLADSDKHVIPGHDPLVMKRYPPVSKDLEGIAVRLDVMPRD